MVFTMISEALESRVGRLAGALTAFSTDLRLAYSYIQPDAASSLTKSRMILEQLLVQVYIAEMGKEPKKPLLGEMLADNQFTRTIERRILSRINAIRDLANLGPHGGKVEASDAIRVLDDLCEVLDWHLVRCSQSPKEGEQVQARIVLEVGGRRLTLDPTQDRRIIIGRGRDCDLCLAEMCASKKHAMILYDRAKGWLLQDLDSYAGVFLNQTQVEKALLKAGDHIRIGSTLILVCDVH